MTEQYRYLKPADLALIGTEQTGEPDYVERNDVRFFAEATRLPDAPKRLYTDEAYARKTRYGGIIAPPTYLTRLARRAGLPWPLPPPFPEWIQALPGVNAGAAIELREPLRPGDTISTTAKIVDICEKQGSRGTLILVVRDFEFTNQLGQYVGKTRRTTIKFPEQAY